MQLGSNQKQMQQDYAAWYTFVEEPRLRKEAARSKAAKAAAKATLAPAKATPAKDTTNNLDVLLGCVVIAAMIYVGSIYHYLVDIVASALNGLAAFIPFL